MELVYLWVDDYKNIKNQGFNFSPQFHCEYNKETNKLIINDDKDYIPNFFGKDINITAIVGKNGSGKSSIFEILSLLYYRGYTKRKDKTFFIHRIGENLFLTCENYKYLPKNIENFNKFITIKNNSKSNQESPSGFSSRGDMKVISFSNCISDITNNNGDKAFNALKNYSYFHNGVKSQQILMTDNHSHSSNNQKIQHLLKKDKSFFNKENLAFDSYQFELHISEAEVYIQGIETKIKNLMMFKTNKVHLSPEELIYKLITSLAYMDVISTVYNSDYKNHPLNTGGNSAVERIKNIKKDMEIDIDNEFISQLKGKKINTDYFNKSIEIYNKYLHKCRDVTRVFTLT